MKRGAFCLCIVFLLILSASVSAGSAGTSSGDNLVQLYIFHSSTCPHCKAELKFLHEIAGKYPTLNISELEVNGGDNSALFMKMMEAYQIPPPYGVPATFIGDSHFIGFDTAENIGSQIEGQINQCIKEKCSDAFDRIKNGRTGILLKEGQVITKDEHGATHEIEVFDINKEKKSCGFSIDGEQLWIDVGANGTLSGVTINVLGAGFDNASAENNRWCNFLFLDISQSPKINIPFLGEIELEISKIGLPVFTLIVAGLDSINPCAIWVLCFLLTLMIYAKSRKRMLLIGSIFVLASGIVYFIFMAAWLNFFLIVGYVNILRIIVSVVAIIVGLFNVKDFFYFKKGLSFTIPDKWKPHLFKRMRGLVHEGAVIASVLGTIILAFMANTFEVVCTFGLPAIYTRVLTLQHLPMTTYYMYLFLYNLIYIVPLTIIVLVFVLTMGTHKFTEKHGRILKLIAGLLMLVLGLVLLLRPELLSF